jgi:ATP adenylyltransferase
MAYILAGEEQSAECIFCAFPARGPERYREHLILAATPMWFVIMNRYPYNNGHIMVVPRRHVSDPLDLPADEHAALSETLRKAGGILRRALGAHGLNVGMNLGRVAGAGIEHHCHWHIVPRWNGDTNFMPVIGEVKVMSDHLDSGYDRLQPAFAELA